MSESFQQQGQDNVVQLGAQVELAGYLFGHHNRVEIGDAAIPSRLRLRIHGNHNHVRIAHKAEIKDLTIVCGTHVPAHNVRVEIDEEFTIEVGGRFLLYNSGNRLSIGRECMFSNGVTIRCGESPHLIFDRDSGDYRDVSDGVFIGHHVWVGEDAYITKAVSIGDESIVGARSVVTRRFTDTHVALAGNPARVVREQVQWIRNPGLLEPGSRFHRSYHEQLAEASAAPADAPPREGG